MNKPVSHGRIVAGAVIFAVLLLLFITTIFKLQIVEGEKYYNQSNNARVSYETVYAARGFIMDRYGRVLIANRECNNLTINTNELFNTEGIDPNENILLLVNTITRYGDSYTDTLPITSAPPFEYTEMTDIQREMLSAYLKDKKLSEDTTAVELLSYMRSRYSIDSNYTAEEARIIAGVRYEINVRYSLPTSDYIFVQDASMDLITKLMESGAVGFDVQTSYIREYNTPYAAHLLGYTGMMTAEEYQNYQFDGYSYNAVVGKTGAELAFESLLHGKDGQARVTSTATGVVTSTEYTVEPVPGNNVYLTIDISLQEAAENALSTYIEEENMKREIENPDLPDEDKKQLITGGAVAIVEVDTGEPLALASWPSFDLETFLEDYEELIANENTPLINRALVGTYAPGSTFKPCTAIAALDSEIIDPATVISCTGVFDKYAYAGYAPRCWIWAMRLTHGPIDLPMALTVSCNYYFYTISDYLGIDRLSAYAKLCGLGEPTGIELAESLGHMSTPEYKYTAFKDTEEDTNWHVGDTIQTGIGQYISEFTPIQMAEYCAMTANGGQRHTASLLKAARSFDNTASVFQREAVIMSEIDTDPAYYQAIREGMYGVITDEVNGTAVVPFEDAEYTVAGKTGTAQVGEGQTNNGIFICFAPYEKPEIAIAIVLEHGVSGATIAPIAREILDYYFNYKSDVSNLESENTLLP